MIEGAKTPFGTIAGTVISGIAGSAVGDVKGTQIAALPGGATGAIGSAVEEEVTKRQVIEIVQEADPKKPFTEGDRVRMTHSRGVARVAH